MGYIIWDHFTILSNFFKQKIIKPAIQHHDFTNEITCPLAKSETNISLKSTINNGLTKINQMKEI